MKRPATYGIVLLLASLWACSSGKMAYQRGDFAEAVKKASERLRQPRGWGRRGHQLAAEVVQRAFNKGYEQHQANIRRLSADAQRPLRWEAVFAEYETLQAMTTDARRALDNVPEPQQRTWLANYPTDYAAQLAETRQLAAADRYALAEAAFEHHDNDRLAAREAHEQYEAAQRWVPNYRQSAQRAQEAFNAAVLRVLIAPPVLTPALHPTDVRAVGQSIFASLTRHNVPSPYVHLYQPDQVEVSIDGTYRLFDAQPIHEVVQVAVSDYDPFNESHATACRTIESSREYKVGTKRINDSTVVDVLEKVRGTITLHTYRIEAGLRLQLRALDAESHQPLWTDTDAVGTEWVGQWETFSGDERALDSYTLKTMTGTPPCAADLLRDLISSAGGSVVGTVRQHYRKR